MRFLIPIALRMALVVVPRAAISGEAVGYGTSFHDLRGHLPERSDIHYATRQQSDVEGVVFHHSATKGQTIRSIAQFHAEFRGWPAIAYHFAIGWDGVIYQCHDVTTVSYHASGYNRHTIGVVLIGNYEEREMTEEMEDAAIALNEYLKDEYDLKFMWLHKDTKKTLCPGKYAEPFLRMIQYGPLPKKQS